MLRLVATILGLLYGLLLAWLGWLATGAGHGTFFFLSVAVFPYGVGLLLWPVIGYLLAGANSRLDRLMFVIIVVIRYGLLAIYVLVYGNAELSHIVIASRYSQFYIFAPLITFLVGQVLIWAIFIAFTTIMNKRLYNG